MKEPTRPEDRRRTRVKKVSSPIIKVEAVLEKPKIPQKAPRKQPTDAVEDLSRLLSQKVVGQPDATRIIVPYIRLAYSCCWGPPVREKPRPWKRSPKCCMAPRRTC